MKNLTKKVSRTLSDGKDKLVNKLANTKDNLVNTIDCGLQKRKACADLKKGEVKDILNSDTSIRECTSLQQAYESLSFRHFFAKMTSKISKKEWLDDDLHNPQYWETEIIPLLCMGVGYLNMTSQKIQQINTVLKSMKPWSQNPYKVYADTVLKRAVSMKNGKNVNVDQPLSIIRDESWFVDVSRIMRIIANYRFDSIPTWFWNPKHFWFDDLAKDWKNFNTGIFLKTYLETEDKAEREAEKEKREAKEKQREADEKAEKEKREAEEKQREAEIHKDLEEIGVKLPIERVNEVADFFDNPNLFKATCYLFSKGNYRDKDMQTVGFWEKNLPILYKKDFWSLDKGAKSCFKYNEINVNYDDYCGIRDILQWDIRRIIVDNWHTNHNFFRNDYRDGAGRIFRFIESLWIEAKKSIEAEEKGQL